MKLTLRIVDDQACPECGAIWGHKDEALNFPNRPKITGADNVTWWKCCNPECRVQYYEPKSGEIEDAVLSQEKGRELMAKVDAMDLPDIEDIFGGDE